MIYVVIYSMNNFTFLPVEVISGVKELDIFKRYGTSCAITDFAILLGGDVASNSYTTEGNSLKDRACFWWTKSKFRANVISVDHMGNTRLCNPDIRNCGARPALPYSLISSIASNNTRGRNGILEVEYGEYPQTVVSENIANNLESAYLNRTMNITGKKYTTDGINCNNRYISFQAISHTEYEYNGRKYIRFVNDYNYGNKQVLSNGRKIQDGDVYWIEVEPIKWIIDEKVNLALSKKVIFSGVQFNRVACNRVFNNNDIKQFMDNYFSKEIVVGKTYSQTTSTGTIQNSSPTISTGQIQDIKSKEPVRKQNPYNFNFNRVSEEDIIRGAIESNVSVFLHGRSSEGKSARVKQLDPDCEIIYLRNATPDSLNGKSVYNSATGEMIDVPPTWYSKVKAKCEAEPNKIHIIFFDELTNALPSIQGMAFNIVLDGEVNGKWKLPSNARIVAAGNDLNDSLAANQMVEPLFNRFAHVYINTTVNSWLKWASTPKEQYERLDYQEEKSEAKIHPSVYAYIAYKSYSGQDVLRTPYTGDKPNADPRKWEMASKVLFKTKQPEMLRALIGKELTKDFTAFTRQQVISVDDVINNNYSRKDLEMDVSQKFATAVGLSSVDEEHFEIARNFMKKVGAEARAAFDSIWTHGDERRLEKLVEVKMSDKLSQGGTRR